MHNRPADPYILVPLEVGGGLVQGIADLALLRILDVGNNFLTAITPLTKLTALREIWINDNRLDNLDEVLSSLQVPGFFFFL